MIHEMHETYHLPQGWRFGEGVFLFSFCYPHPIAEEHTHVSLTNIYGNQSSPSLGQGPKTAFSFFLFCPKNTYYISGSLLFFQINFPPLLPLSPPFTHSPTQNTPPPPPTF